MNTNHVRIETAEQLEEIVAAQNEAILGLGELVKGMDARIKLLTSLIDNYHSILIQHGLAKPRPTGDALAN
jgi:hypothetical protein